MQKQPALKRANISAPVADAVRAMIVEGRLAEGARINEVHLAQSLSVSRTPVREALNRLVAEGALESTPSFGYFVRPLALDEFEQLYAIRPLLDPEALRLAGLPTPERLARLRKLNDRIEAARDPERIIDLDDAWHGELIAACPNRVLLDLIGQFMRRTRRYERALMRERKNVLVAGTNHRAIMAALRRKDLGGACAALRHNLTTGHDPIVAWLKQRTLKD
jgi:DNA-binding GntR family transcriptional regulator